MRWLAYAPSVVLAIWALAVLSGGVALVPVWLLAIALAVVIQVTVLKSRYRDE